VKVTESAWTVSGFIYVKNPNDWEDITASVSDALSDSGGVCSGGSVTVQHSSTAKLQYSCSFTSLPSSASGTNIAKATWSAATSFTPDGSASGSAGYTFATYTVTDCFSAKGTACTQNTLGSVTIPPGSATFTYARTVNNALGGSRQDNEKTATITQTGQQASAAVTVCNTKTGALTMGFWQNKNGQGIITGGASTGGVCNSGTWLRQFNPFQDLSASATCAQVAAYVYNIIKSANANTPSGSMNAMLKGQMLATALDVYFGGGPGGNPLGAPTPLSIVKIDLTKVCNMVDNTGGIGTCNGTSENVSSAFGGAPSMMLMNMLLYQNNVSNASGSTWYGNVKSVQALAKDVFDAINNQAANIAP